MSVDVIGDLGNIDKVETAAKAVEQDAITRFNTESIPLLEAAISRQIDRLEAIAKQFQQITFGPKGNT